MYASAGAFDKMAKVLVNNGLMISFSAAEQVLAAFVCVFSTPFFAVFKAAWIQAVSVLPRHFKSSEIAVENVLSPSAIRGIWHGVAFAVSKPYKLNTALKAALTGIQTVVVSSVAADDYKGNIEEVKGI